MLDFNYHMTLKLLKIALKAVAISEWSKNGIFGNK